MVNNRVNRKKIGQAAGINDKDATLAAIYAIQTEMQEEWELQGTGILKSAIMENLQDKGDYLVIKAYVNKEKERFAEDVKNNEEMTH